MNAEEIQEMIPMFIKLPKHEYRLMVIASSRLGMPVEEFVMRASQQALIDYEDYCLSGEAWEDTPEEFFPRGKIVPLEANTL